MRFRTLAILLVPLTLGLTDCHCQSALGTVTGNPRLDGPAPLGVAGDGKSATLDFGPVRTDGDAATHAIIIENTGNASLTIMNVTASTGLPAAFIWSTSALKGQAIPADGQIVFDLGFAPTQIGAAEGTLHIETDVPETVGSGLEVHLKGMGVVAVCGLEPAPLDFGQLDLHARATRSLRISNPSAVAWKVTPTSFTGTDAAAFSTGALGTTRTLAPGASWEVPITLQVERLGAFSADLQLSSEGNCAGSVALTANVICPQDLHIVDTFDEPAPPKVDVVVSAMANGEAYTEDAGFPELLQTWMGEGGGMDARVAMVVGGVEEGDAYVSYAAWPDTFPTLGELIVPDGGAGMLPLDAALPEALRERTYYGAYGIPPVLPLQYHCFDSLIRAVTPPLSTDGRGVTLRPGAIAVFVCASWIFDDRSGAVTFAQPTTAIYREPTPVIDEAIALRSASPLLRFVSFSAGQDTTCNHLFYVPTDLPRMRSMVQILGGVSIDHCEGSTQALDDLRGLIAGLQVTFPLSARPDLSKGPITVSLNGHALPEGVSWTYDPTANQVVLAGPERLAYRDRVTVAYTTFCR